MVICWVQELMRNYPESGETCESAAPKGLRGVLEVTRRHLLALFRTLDLLNIAQDLPSELQSLFELDATLAEALWVLDQPKSGFNVDAMTRDSTSAVDAVTEVFPEFLQSLLLKDRQRVGRMVPKVLETLSVEDAYNQIPGRDPAAG